MINIDGKQIKLQIWDTVRAAPFSHFSHSFFTFDASLLAFSNYQTLIHCCVHFHLILCGCIAISTFALRLGRPGVVPVDHAELLSRRGRRPPRLRHHQVLILLSLICHSHSHFPSAPYTIRRREATSI